MYTRFLFYQILGVTLPFRHVFKVLNDYEAYSQWHLKDTLQLKILRTWIDIRVNSFLDKFHETKMDEDASEIISCTKSEPVLWRTSHQDISLIIIFFFFSETNLNFKFNLAISLPFYFFIPCVSWSSISASKFSLYETV